MKTVLWAFVLCASASAQEAPPPQDLSELSLDELMNLNVKVVYAASRYVQRVSDAPASVTVIGADEIRKYGYRTLADALRSVRGVYVTYDRNYSYLGIRGFGLPSDFNSRELFTIDGHRVNENVYDGALIGGEFPLDIDLVERIEVVRGPGSSLYGSNAFFGVVNVMTRQGRSLDGVEISGSAGSFDSYTGRVSYGKKFENGVELLVSGTVADSGGQRLKYQEYDDPATGNGVVENDAEFYFSTLVQASWQHLTLQAAYVSREKEVPTGSYGTAFPSRRTATWDDRGYVDLKYEREFEGDWGLLARLYADIYSYRGDYEYEDVSSGTPVRYLNKDSATGTWWGGELKLTKALWEDRARLTVGGEFRENVRQVQKNYDETDPKTTYLESREYSYVAAAYAQADVAVVNEVRVNAGLRFDSYDTFGSSLAPRAALIVNPVEGTTLKALYGRAFRAPSAYELYYADNGLFQKANPDLDPETVDTYELILEQALDKGVTVAAGGFITDVHDLITQVQDPADGLAYFDNVDEVRTYGAEADLEWRLESGIRGSAGYTYALAVNRDTDSQLANSPRHLAKLNVSVPLLAEKVFGGLELQYVGERRTLARNVADDFVLVNLTLYSRELMQGLDFSATVYNLLDTRATDPGGIEHAQDEIEQDGISFRLKLTWRF